MKVRSIEEALVDLVEDLADEYKWSWQRPTDQRGAANAVLTKMTEVGLIRHDRHPLGGDIWIVGSRIFGKTDGLYEAAIVATETK